MNFVCIICERRRWIGSGDPGCGMGVVRLAASSDLPAAAFK
jgi:hypothetical protein